MRARRPDKLGSVLVRAKVAIDATSKRIRESRKFVDAGHCAAVTLTKEVILHAKSKGLFPKSKVLVCDILREKSLGPAGMFLLPLKMNALVHDDIVTRYGIRRVDRAIPCGHDEKLMLPGFLEDLADLFFLGRCRLGDDPIVALEGDLNHGVERAALRAR